jgi:hypothetical protein
MSYTTHICRLETRQTTACLVGFITRLTLFQRVRLTKRFTGRLLYLILPTPPSPGPKFGVKRTARITSDPAAKPDSDHGNSSDWQWRDSMSGCWEIRGACYLQVSRYTGRARSDLGAVDRPIGQSRSV